MSIALINAELRTQLSSALVITTSPLGVPHQWPVQWPNEPWPAGISVSEGMLPLNPDGTPLPCIRAENIAGEDTATIGMAGNRRGTRHGLLRLFLMVGQNTGLAEIDTQSDAIWPIFKRQTPFLQISPSARLTTMDPRVYDGVAEVDTGDRFVRMITCPWYFEYLN